MLALVPSLGYAELSSLAGFPCSLGCLSCNPQGQRCAPSTFTQLSHCYFRPSPLTDSFTLFFGQEKADTAEGNAGRLWRRYLPGHCHHSHGDAQNPAAGCGANWYVVFSSLCTGQSEGKGLGLGCQGRGGGNEQRKTFFFSLLSQVRAISGCSRSSSSSS